MKLTVRVRSGISSDGFETILSDGDTVVDKKRWDYGRDCTYNKDVEETKPYVTDVLEKLIADYQVNELSVEAGKNVFAGKDVRPERVKAFENNFCTGLREKLIQDDFTSAVENISTQEAEQKL